MSKVIFVVQRRAGMSREDCHRQWNGERHTSIVRRIPGLTRWVQNAVVSAPSEPVCDGVGELWFPADDVMQQALSSPEMAAAVEDARTFLDMDRTGLVIVDERVIIGDRAAARVKG